MAVERGIALRNAGSSGNGAACVGRDSALRRSDSAARSPDHFAYSTCAKCDRNGSKIATEVFTAIFALPPAGRSTRTYGNAGIGMIMFEVLLLFNLLIAGARVGVFPRGTLTRLKIDRFAISFGKPIWKKKVGGVEYALGWIPAGGYVALPQMATMEAIGEQGDAVGRPLPAISPLDKTVVTFAGPLFSFLLALVFAVVVWAVGRPVNSRTATRPPSGGLSWVGRPGRPGCVPGDAILEVDGHPVDRFSPAAVGGRGRGLGGSITWRIITSEGTNIAIRYRRDGGADGLCHPDQSAHEVV